MPDDPVVVPEAAPVVVERPKALRIFIGRFIVDFIETFAASIAGVALFVPATTEDWRKIAIVIGTPAASAFISAGRRAWPTIRSWLTGEENPRDVGRPD